MTELSRQQATADTEARLTATNTSALHFMFGAQRLLLYELVFVANELVDRARTETHLFSEFSSRLAASHSVRDLTTMYEVCGRHQIDFIRRDCERLFKHGERMIETTSNLFANRLQNQVMRQW
jgi:hypothetical protein